MTQTFHFDTIVDFVGKELGLSEWLLIDQERINAFADATGDHQWIHVDEAKAAATPIGSTIAHGFLTLSLLPLLTGPLGLIPAGAGYVLNYGTDKVRFTNFVKVNARVRVRVKLVEARAKSGGMLMKMENTMEIDGETRPAMIAETLMLALPA